MTESTYPGADLGLPRGGPRSVAPLGVRVGAFAIDVVLAGLLALVFTRPALPQNWSLLSWAVMTVVFVGAFGFTPGQAALGIRVARLGGASLVGWRAVPRTALIFLIVPAVLTDRNGRGVHDRLCGTVVVRTR